jgi:malonyl-CoA O-methyltransferase
MQKRAKSDINLAARFSSAASTYHDLAFIQRHVARQLMKMLPRPSPPARILEIGCGTGVLTKMLATAFPESGIDAVDFSAAMIAEARKNLAGNKMIHWQVADARHISTAVKYPLIISSCTLHWIAPLEPVLKKLSAMLLPGGCLAAAVMTRGTLAELHASRKKIAPHKPARIRLPTAGEIKRALAGSRLKMTAVKTETVRRKYDSVRGIMLHLHKQGLTGTNNQWNAQRRNTLLTRLELARLTAEYEKKYFLSKGVYATYKTFYCMAKQRET